MPRECLEHNTKTRLDNTLSSAFTVSSPRHHHRCSRMPSQSSPVACTNCQAAPLPHLNGTAFRTQTYAHKKPSRLEDVLHYGASCGSKTNFTLNDTAPHEHTTQSSKTHCSTATRLRTRAGTNTGAPCTLLELSSCCDEHVGPLHPPSSSNAADDVLTRRGSHSGFENMRKLVADGLAAIVNPATSVSGEQSAATGPYAK